MSSSNGEASPPAAVASEEAPVVGAVRLDRLFLGSREAWMASSGSFLGVFSPDVFPGESLDERLALIAAEWWLNLGWRRLRCVPVLFIRGIGAERGGRKQLRVSRATSGRAPQ